MNRYIPLIACLVLASGIVSYTGAQSASRYVQGEAGPIDQLSPFDEKFNYRLSQILPFPQNPIEFPYGLTLKAQNFSGYVKVEGGVATFRNYTYSRLMNNSQYGIGTTTIMVKEFTIRYDGDRTKPTLVQDYTIINEGSKIRLTERVWREYWLVNYP